MDSIWTRTAQLPPFAPLPSDLRTDVLIIGGGLAGLLCAYKLSQAGVDYALVEADRICGGITKNTTAKITSQHGLVYHKLIGQFGVERARLYLEANQAALAQYRKLCQDIDCDFEEKDAFVYSTDSRRKLDQELAALDRLGFAAAFSEHIPLPIAVAGAIQFPRQAQFHPLKFVAAIAKNLRIFERTKVVELGPGKAVTHAGTITAKAILVATHFPLLNKHGSYFLKLYQHRSYVLALENAPENVEFPGFVDRERLREAYCGADVFAFMSHEETEGIVVLEALACGIPTLLRDIPVYDGWLTHGENVYKASGPGERVVLSPGLEGKIEREREDLYACS